MPPWGSEGALCLSFSASLALAVFSFRIGRPFVKDGGVGKMPQHFLHHLLTSNSWSFLLNQDWLIKCLESSVVQTQIVDATTKVGQPKLAIMRIQEIIIPLPPLAEQERIVAKLEQVLPKCEELR